MEQTSINAVERELDVLMQSGADRSGPLGAEHRELWDALVRATRGGKRFRPALVLAAHDTLDGTAHRAAARTGAALEILHTSFIVHDDVIDGDNHRRGRPNVSGTFAGAARDRGATQQTARRFAAAAGILAGDLALLSATRMIASCGGSPEAVDRLLDLLEEAVHTSATGELADVRLALGLEHDPATVDDALRVAELKTAAYSFELPLRAGAVLADAPAAMVATLGEIGRLLGVGFQMLDDLLGVFGDENRTGKSALSDLREGKCTVLIAYARTSPSWPALRPLVGTPHLEEDGAARARELLTECGARAAAHDLADRHLDDALETARYPDIPPALTAVLVEMVDDIRIAAREALLPGPSCSAPRDSGHARSEQGA